MVVTTKMLEELFRIAIFESSRLSCEHVASNCAEH